MFEIIFILLMLGMIGATVFVGLRERKPRVKGAKSSKSKDKNKTKATEEPSEQADEFGGGNQEQFDFNPDEFK